ncbi:MAG TPA: acyltransferase [Rhodanobacter sp.]|nr:acyltransferase [Rhodanobacter sp.]
MRDASPTLSRQHFAALDGLRGVAIVLVLLHGFDVIQPSGTFGHALDDLLDLGWIGVQLFFVLSGFLITGILLDTRQASGYYRSFFKRRFLRIFPLYYGVLIVAFVLLPWLVGPIDGSGHQLWLWIYVANFTAPFGASVPAFPHFWSLCVEEQFYLLWPLLVRQLGRRGVLVVSSVLVLVAMASRIYVRHHLGEPIGHEAAYSFTPCRMDALAIGALVAALLRGGGGAARVAERRPGLVASIGLLVLLGGAAAGHLQRTGAMMQAFGYTVIAVGFALLLVGALGRSGLAARALAWTPLRHCGIYSYGMYVFYAPLHLFVGLPLLATFAAAPTLAEALAYEVIAIAATFALGALSWHAYERHFLALKARLAPLPVP